MTDDDMYCCGNWQRHWHVYYCYAADDTLLYVGQTSEFSSRLYHHSRPSTGSTEWFGRCTRVELSPQLGSSAEARAAERNAITRLAPVYNRQHNPTPTQWMPPAPERAERAHVVMPDVVWPSAPERQRASAAAST